MFANGVWLAQKKQMLRDTVDKAFVCPLPEPQMSDEFGECTYADFVASLEATTSKLEDQVDEVVQTLLNAGKEFISNVNQTVESVVGPIDTIVRGADCSSLHHWASYAVDSGCSHVVNNLALVSIFWIIIGAECFVAFFVYGLVAKHLRYLGTLYAQESRRQTPVGRGQPIPAVANPDTDAINREYEAIAGTPAWMKFDKDQQTGGARRSAGGAPDSRSIRYL